MSTPMKRPDVLLALAFLATACLGPHGPATVKEGTTAPTFRLPSATGGQVGLEDFKGKRPVLFISAWGPGEAGACCR